MSLFIGDLAGYKYKQKDERIGWHSVKIAGLDAAMMSCDICQPGSFFLFG